MTDDRLRELNFKHEKFIQQMYDRFYALKKSWGLPKPRTDKATGKLLPPRKSKARELVESTLNDIEAYLNGA